MEYSKNKKIEIINFIIKNLSKEEQFICHLASKQVYNQHNVDYADKKLFKELKILFPELDYLISSTGKTLNKKWKIGDPWHIFDTDTLSSIDFKINKLKELTIIINI